jgi:hypothetical protein
LPGVALSGFSPSIAKLRAQHGEIALANEEAPRQMHEAIQPLRIKMAKMRVHRVQLMPEGKLDGEGYKEVQATTEKEAAEKLYGSLLFKQGPAARVRAMVLSTSATDNPTLFYER